MPQPTSAETASNTPLPDARANERARMVENQIAARGIADPRVLAAMRAVPREAFVDEALAEFAYIDSPLPIAEDQTISQPFIVAYMAEQAEIGTGDRVLEIGTGSGYAAAVFARIVDKVFTVERHPGLAEAARAALQRIDVNNVTVACGDGTRGWQEEGPFEAILVAAGAPRLPESLKRQLSIGGRLVIPVDRAGGQHLLRIRRRGSEDFAEEDLGAVRFVPLIGEEGWDPREGPDAYGGNRVEPARPEQRPDGPEVPSEGPEVLSEEALITAIAEGAEPLPDVDDPAFAAPFDRLGDAKVVGLGEATHGTSEFYRARAAITRRLVEAHGFTIVALEADWPDAARLDRYVRHRGPAPWSEPAFTRFPTWMWRNAEILALIDWLRDWNADRPPEARVSVHGLDLYALRTSIAAVIAYLEQVDPEAAAVSRERYACLTPWQKDPASYGRAALTRGLVNCERAAVAQLQALLEKRVTYAAADPDDYLDAEGNAHLVAAAEEYYRTIYYGDVQSWNLRDTHMVDTLDRVRAARPGPAKAVVWAHNSHIGDAGGTEMGIARDEVNVGQLCRERYGSDAALVGFGTHEGSVMAARDWDTPGTVREVRPSRRGSVEALCHAASGQRQASRFLLDLGLHAGTSLAHTLLGPRLQRAIGVIYRPETELASHYFEVSLPRQFDHYVWIDRTEAVRPLEGRVEEGAAETYPFGL